MQQRRQEFSFVIPKKNFATIASNSGRSATWRGFALLLFKQTGLLFVRSTDSSS
jgi:hypothetical protein